MQQIVTENFLLWQGDLLVEVQDNEKEAIIYCCSSHYNIDEQSLHQGILVCISNMITGKEIQQVKENLCNQDNITKHK